MRAWTRAHARIIIPGMDRRTFAKLLLAGAGSTLLPRSAAMAALPEHFPFIYGAAGHLEKAMAPPVPAIPAGLQGRPFSALLERARAALDRHKDAFALRDRVAIADFSVASRDARFHIVDLIGGQATSYLVAHGRGSDPEHSGWLQRFSNEPNSLATSHGAYRTAAIYDGQHGASMRLLGLDPENSNAEARAIVIHGADYVSEDRIASWGKLGRSEGCFALAQHVVPQVLAMLGPGRLLYADKS
jgi:hypothetical protein